MKKMLQSPHVQSVLDPNPKENQSQNTNNPKLPKTKSKPVLNNGKPKYLSNHPTQTRKIQSYLQAHRTKKKSQKNLKTRSTRSNKKNGVKEQRSPMVSQMTSTNVSTQNLGSVNGQEVRTRKESYLKSFLQQMSKTNRQVTEEVMEDYDGPRMKAKKMMLYSNLRYQKK